MSTRPMGPGWWQASDDRWYPPESHPDYRPGTPWALDPPTPPMGTPPAGSPTPQPSGPAPAPALAEVPTSPAPSGGSPPPHGLPPGTPTATAPSPAGAVGEAAPGGVVPKAARNTRRDQRLMLGIVALVVLGVGAYVGIRDGLASTGPSGPTGAKVAAALAVARTKGSVSVHVHVSASTGEVLTIAAAASLDAGSEHLSNATGAWQVTCVPGACYVEGDETALEHQYGMSPAAATAAAGKWLSVPADAPTTQLHDLYTQVATSTTLTSLLTQLDTFKNVIGHGTATLFGKPVETFAGTCWFPGAKQDGPAELYLLPTGAHTLVRFSATVHDKSVTLDDTEIFYDWGTTPVAKPPLGAVPMKGYLPKST